MESVQEQLQEEKERVINLLLIIFGAVGIPVICVSLFRALEVGMNLSLWVQATMGALLLPLIIFRKSVPYIYKVGFTISIPMLMGFGGIYTFGLMDASVMLLISGSIIASTLGGLRWGIITTGISSAYITFIYFLLFSGRHSITIDPVIYLNLHTSWIIFLVAYAALSIVVCFLVSRQFKVAYDSLEKVQIHQRELEESNLTKDQLFQLIAHDLRSPFQGLISGLELFAEQEGILNEEQKQKLFKSILRDSTSTFAMLENLLYWSKAQSGNLVVDAKYIEVDKILEDCISPYQRLAEQKEINIDLRVPKGLLAFADEHSVKIILCNLIHNAIKFTEAGGNIDVSGELKDGFACITVSDNGIGISESEGASLFSKNKNVSRRGTADESGTGLGLNVSFELAKFNKGSLHFEENSTGGSNFVLQLSPAT